MGKQWALLAAFLLSACATTDPGPGARIAYRLPRTDVVSTLSLELTDCKPVTVNATLKLAAASGAQPTEYYIRGEDLASSRIKRGLKIVLDDKRVLAGVNSSVSDRTPTIIGNYLTAATKLLPFLSTKMSTKPACSLEAKALVDRRQAIKTQVAALRSELNVSASTNKVPTEDDRARMKDIENLSKELAGITPLLNADLTAKIEIERDSLGSTKSTTVVFKDLSPIAPWMTGKPNEFILGNLVQLSWSAKETDAPSQIALRPAGAAKKLRRCGFDLAIADPKPIRVTVTGTGTIVTDKVAETIDIPAAQVNGPRTMCLDAGFGESRSLELAFDAYGQVTSYSWNSEARGEAISAFVAGNAGNLVSIVDGLEGPSKLERQKAEIEELEAAQKLAKLRACKAIMAAGGTC